MIPGDEILKPKQKRREPVTSDMNDLNRGERNRTHLVISSGEADLSGLRLVTRDWLVPRLVEKFLAARGTPAQHDGHVGELQISPSKIRKSVNRKSNT